MSGIAGTYSKLRPNVTKGDVDRLLAPMAPRGPNGTGAWVDSARMVGLGHLALWSTPESVGVVDPEILPERGLTITADVRLDNRDELNRLLSHRHIKTCSDQFVIMLAYERWGIDCVDHLLGAFAFAIWDEKEKRLFCGRDHLGVKPFYYAYQNDRFVFASEPKGVLAAEGISDALNIGRIVDALSMMFADPIHSAYEQVLKLPPAHRLVLDHAGLRVDEYWRLDPEKEIHLSSLDEYADTFRELLTEAVRCRLRTVGKVGAQLSGGLDSSSVVALARKFLIESGQQLHTYSAVFDDVPECDERHFIRDLTHMDGIVSSEIRCDQRGPFSRWEDEMGYEDEPFRPGNHFVSAMLVRAARNDGCTVVLDGIDGDTTVWNGYGYLRELARGGEWREFAELVNQISQVEQRSARTYFYEYGVDELDLVLKRDGVLPYLSAVSAAGKSLGFSRRRMALEGWKWRNGRPKPASKRMANHLVNESLASRVNLEQRLLDFEAQNETSVSSRLDQWRMLTSGIVSLSMEGYDRLAASDSIEHRHPFMDKRLVEFALAVPPQHKLSFGYERFILRYALRGELPASIRRRSRKTNLAPNFQRGIRKFDYSFVAKVLESDTRDVEEVINIPKLRRAFNDFMTSDDDAVSLSSMLWNGVYTILWMRRGKDNQFKDLEIDKEMSFAIA